MPKPAPSSSSLLEAGFELVNVKQYGGEEQVKLKVVVKIPGSWFDLAHWAVPALGNYPFGFYAQKYV